MPSILNSTIQIGMPLIKEHKKKITLSTSAALKQINEQEI
jgi:hypothetical protein